MKVVSESMECLLFNAFLDQIPCDLPLKSMDFSKLDTLMKFCNEENFLSELEDQSTLLLMKTYEEFQENVCNGHLGKTAAFWMSFLDHARRVFILLCAVKANKFPLFHKCMAYIYETKETYYFNAEEKFSSLQNFPRIAIIERSMDFSGD